MVSKAFLFQYLIVKESSFQPWPGQILRQYSITRGFKGAYEWPEDGPFGSPSFVECHPPYINSFLSNFQGTEHTLTCLRWCSTPINKWMLLDLILREFIHQMNGLGSQTRLNCDSKTIFMSLQIFEFHNSYVLFARMASMGDQKDHAWPGPQRRKKKGRKNEISTTCWLFLNEKVTNGSRKVHGVRMAFACHSFRSSCGPYKAHGTYAMFLH